MNCHRYPDTPCRFRCTDFCRLYGIGYPKDRGGGLYAQYLFLPGVAGNYASTPDSVALSFTGDFDLRAHVALDDWTPAADGHFIAKIQTSTTRTFRFYIRTDGLLALAWSTNGTAEVGVTSSVATGLADGDEKHVRVTFDADNGSSNREIKFYLSDDGVTWTQLGTTGTHASTGALFDSNSIVEVGSRIAGTTDRLAGKVYRAKVYDGIDGTLVADFNASEAFLGASSVVSSSTGEAWSIKTSGSVPAALVR